MLARIEETPEEEIRYVGEVVDMSANQSIFDEKGKIYMGLLESIMSDFTHLKYCATDSIVGNVCCEEAKLR